MRQSPFPLVAMLWRGALIAAVRLMVFWAALGLSARYSDWRQVLGYLLLMVNSIVEIGITSIWTRDSSVGSVVATCLIVATSGVLGWVWTRRHIRRGTES